MRTNILVFWHKLFYRFFWLWKWNSQILENEIYYCYYYIYLEEISWDTFNQFSERKLDYLEMKKKHPQGNVSVLLNLTRSWLSHRSILDFINYIKQYLPSDIFHVHNTILSFYKLILFWIVVLLYGILMWFLQLFFRTTRLYHTSYCK